MTIIRVAADEWIIANHGSGHVLVTNGFSGCVGVALIGKSKCLLSHVFSDCTEKTWSTYKPRIETMLRTFQQGGEAAESSALVYADDEETETLKLLFGFLCKHSAVHPKKIKDAGCVVSAGTNQMVVRRQADPKDSNKSIKIEVPVVGDMSFATAKSSHYDAGGGVYSGTAQMAGIVGGMLNGKQWPVT